MAAPVGYSKAADSNCASEWSDDVTKEEAAAPFHPQERTRAHF